MTHLTLIVAKQELKHKGVNKITNMMWKHGSFPYSEHLGGKGMEEEELALGVWLAAAHTHIFECRFGAFVTVLITYPPSQCVALQMFATVLYSIKRGQM